jgi:hypothetical protein
MRIWTRTRRRTAFPFTDALERLLQAQKAEHDRLKAAGVICPWVFNRSNRKVKGKRITTFIKGLQDRVYEGGLASSDSARPLPHRVRKLVRAGVPEGVAMQVTGHKTIRAQSSPTAVPA